MNLKKLTIIICIIWVSIITFGVIRNEFILTTGKKVLLRTVPVDPKDLLMGDYVTLNYEISQLPQNYDYLKTFKNKEVYVVLKTDKDNIATIDRIQTEKEPDEPLFIKGKISKCNTIIPLWKTGTCINYGIESYYVKEHTGKDLEKNLRNGALVKVSIDRYGNAKIMEIVNK